MAVPLARAATTLNEADLIRRAQKGDGDAFASLVEAYDNNVLRIAYNLLRNEDEARDIYQEAFLRVFKNLDNFRFDCAFHTWLYRIVTNLCLDHLRRRKVRKEDYSTQQLDSVTTNAVDRMEEHRASSDPQRHLISKQLGDRIRQAMESLSPRERMVFELRHYQGMRLRGIGETLGTTEEAAKNCLFRATQKMRAAFGRLRMNCELARQNMTLFVHGELNFDEEEQLERHTASCPSCARELALERAVLDLADANRLEPSPAQLATARNALANRLAAQQASWRHRLGARLGEWFDFHPGLRWSFQPIAGLLLLGAGYWGGAQPSLQVFNKPALQSRLESNPSKRRVRFVKSGAGGQIELLVDEIRQIKVRGTVEDSTIRELLLIATKDPDDAGLRAEVFDVLKGRTGALDVRAALISLLEKDPSSEVRMKVLESLRPYAAYPDVRLAMSNALLDDTSSEVRIMAIDMLVSVDKPDVAGTLQKLLENEPDQYLRQRSQAALVAMKASTNTF